jgi:tRNA (guanine26-N2/guanine27-N2)-dimethyltransferase
LLRRVSDANKSIKQVHIISSSSLAFQSDSKIKEIGPLWMGAIQDRAALLGVSDALSMLQCGSERQMRALLGLLMDEAEAPPFFYTLNSIASSLKISPPSRATLFRIFQENNHGIWRTHIDPTGFKTDASETEIIEIFHQAKRIDEQKD